jgi:hypothetical protein
MHREAAAKLDVWVVEQTAGRWASSSEPAVRDQQHRGSDRMKAMESNRRFIASEISKPIHLLAAVREPV